MKIDFVNARVVREGAEDTHPLSISDGIVSSKTMGRSVDLSGYTILPGIIDLHGDGFERHVAPRRGVMKQMTEGLLSVEAELAANGITTAYLAQFMSWEGGVRGPEFAARVMSALAELRDQPLVDMRGQLRLEIHLLECYTALPEQLADWGVRYVVFNDHLPHDRLAEGRKPPRLTGQALKAGRNPDVHFQMLLDLHSRRDAVPPALDALCAQLRAQGVQMGSHDDATPQGRARWLARGVPIAEFPETQAAAAEAGGPVVLGAPNVVRGGSHKGNVSALDLVAMGYCDALASDYHYPSPRRAALMLADAGILSLPEAWGLISSNPAQIMGLDDRGDLSPGQRADLVILDDTRRVALTLCAGVVRYMSGEIAERFAS